LKDDLPDVIIIKNCEPIAQGVKGVSELRIPCHGFQFQLVGLETEIHPVGLQVHRGDLGVVWKVDRPAHIAELFDETLRTPGLQVHAVDPIVDPVLKPIHPKLGVGYRKPGEDYPSHVSPLVPVRVGEI
jgi:hypothetical protein